jgi:hypothetical protein
MTRSRIRRTRVISGGHEQSETDGSTIVEAPALRLGSNIGSGDLQEVHNAKPLLLANLPCASERPSAARRISPQIEGK